MKSGVTLWQLFGSTNQLLAGLALLAITVYLLRQRRPVLAYVLPMVFMLITTTAAIGLKLGEFVRHHHWQLALVSFVILALSLWLIVEAALSTAASRRTP